MRPARPARGSGSGGRKMILVSRTGPSDIMAIIAAINEQHSPAACLAVPWSGQGAGGGACSGHSTRATACGGLVAWPVATGGTISATSDTSQTRSRVAFMSAPATVEDFQQLVDL